MGAVPASALALVVVLSALGTAQILQPRSAEAMEGAPLNLTCEHSSITRGDYIHCTEKKDPFYLYWYRQYPNRTLQYILYKGIRSASSTRGTADFAEERFSSTTDDNSTVLNITALERADTAVYHCALQRHSERFT
ncbi:hypothetical protein Y1Q_0010595 [Alligator mississippiensis]|uniref:Ig-like domain-containing protein n=1 Tax=Alligator mississippiensis TaxID=8496 RepID=A0A151PGJ2_ALLMI|nr:hypothetical protein Y1Q_0010595 [Alligator mississippiensis]